MARMTPIQAADCAVSLMRKWQWRRKALWWLETWVSVEEWRGRTGSVEKVSKKNIMPICSLSQSMKPLPSNLPCKSWLFSKFTSVLTTILHILITTISGSLIIMCDILGSSISVNKTIPPTNSLKEGLYCFCLMCVLLLSVSSNLALKLTKQYSEALSI